jgi:RHS repeat-associated protein
VYTLVGADGRQLATYNGLQGSMCGRNGVRLWPVEFNTYGPNNTRIITRADGTSEVVISDYLGSARVTLSTTAEPLQSSSYHPYGTERTSTGSGARTSYIGREHDNETDLGFYGVRLYEPEYGRFLSTDVLWSKYLPLQPFQYAGNNPVMALDYGGDTIVFLSEKAREQYTVAKEHIISSYPEAASYFSTVENAEDHFIFRTNGNGLNSFEPLATDDGAYQSTSEKRVHGINWDPGHAANLGSMGSLSPSMILFHEILHAAGQVEGGASSEDDGTKLTSPEERRVIAIENAAAKKLGQAARDCHNCAEWEYFVVKNPTEGGSPASEPEQKPTKNSPSTRDQPR